jgi:hypothetical protein
MQKLKIAKIAFFNFLHKIDKMIVLFGKMAIFSSDLRCKKSLLFCIMRKKSIFGSLQLYDFEPLQLYEF